MRAWRIGGAALLGALLTPPLAAQAPAAGQAELDQALDCRAHLATWAAIRPDNERWTRRARRIAAYWRDRSNALGRAAGFDARAMELKDLLIPRNPPDLVPRIERCLRLTPERLMRNRG